MVSPGAVFGVVGVGERPDFVAEFDQFPAGDRRGSFRQDGFGFAGGVVIQAGDRVGDGGGFVHSDPPLGPRPQGVRQVVFQRAAEPDPAADPRRALSGLLGQEGDGR